MLRVRGDLGNRQRRSVAGEDRPLFGERFEFGEHFALDLEILDHGFDDQIGMLKAAPVGCGGDPGNLPLHFAAAHSPPLHFLPPDLCGRAKPAGESVPVDVAHADRRIGLIRDDVGDPAAHHARA